MIRVPIGDIYCAECYRNQSASHPVKIPATWIAYDFADGQGNLEGACDKHSHYHFFSPLESLSMPVVPGGLGDIKIDRDGGVYMGATDEGRSLGLWIEDEEDRIFFLTGEEARRLRNNIVEWELSKRQGGEQ